MRILEISLFAAAVVTIVAVFVAARFRGPRSGKLSRPMLLFLRISLGIAFFILGIVGSLLPILQGWLFFLLSALVLFPQSRFAIKALDKAEPKMPRVVARLRSLGIGTHPEGDTMRGR